MTCERTCREVRNIGGFRFVYAGSRLTIRPTVLRQTVYLVVCGVFAVGPWWLDLLAGPPLKDEWQNPILSIKVIWTLAVLIIGFVTVAFGGRALTLDKNLDQIVYAGRNLCSIRSVRQLVVDEGGYSTSGNVSYYVYLEQAFQDRVPICSLFTALCRKPDAEAFAVGLGQWLGVPVKVD